MFIAPADATRGEDEWRPFVEAQTFGHLVAPLLVPVSRYPVVVPTQFDWDGAEVLVHFAPSRIRSSTALLEANPRALLSVAGDWAFIPSSWKAIGEEDASLGIPTTYYAAVQLKVVMPRVKKKPIRERYILPTFCVVSWPCSSHRPRFRRPTRRPPRPIG